MIRKRLFYAIMLSVSTLCAVAQTDGVNASSIPGWVTNVTTPEQYGILERASRCFTDVDYSFLKRRGVYGNESMEAIFKSIDRMCDKAEKGMSEQADFKKSTGVLHGTVSPEPVRLLSEAVDGNKISKQYVVYSSLDGYDAHMILNVSYTQKDGKLLSSTCYTEYKSLGGTVLDVRFEPDTGMPNSYNMRVADDYVDMTMSGTLRFVTPSGDKISEHVSFSSIVPFVKGQ